jgi:hypothetical protein
MLKSSPVLTSSTINTTGAKENDKKHSKSIKMIDPKCKEYKTHDCNVCMKFYTHNCPSGQPMRLRLRHPLSELSKVFRPNAGEIAIIMVVFDFNYFEYRQCCSLCTSSRDYKPN